MNKFKRTKTFNFTIIAMLLLTMLNILLTTRLFTTTCQAESKQYYYINQNTLLIPQGQNIKGNIQINATYYVQSTGSPDVVINDIPYKIVSYNGIIGRVASSALSKKSISNVSTPYFTSPSPLTAKSEDDNYILMFSNIEDDESECVKIDNDTKLDFIAYSEDGNYILVKSHSTDKIGYVQKKHCTPTIIFTPNPNPIHPDKIQETPPDKDNTSDTVKPDSKAKTTRIILISILCIVVVLIIFLIFKPVKPNHNKNSKDDFYEI